MPKINKEEYQVLKELDDKWKWIARDELRNSVYVFYKKPNKYSTYWEDEDMIYEQIDENLFQFIKWEDEEPHNIAELIEEYEYSTEHVSHVVNERVKALGKAWSESEETEVKDIEWLKEKVKGEYEYNRAKHNKEGFEGYAHREFVFKYVLGLLDKLDEPEVKQLYEKISELESYNDELIRDNNQLRNEIDNQEVLSREWISENVEYAYFDMLDGSGRLSSATAIIKPENLQNLLVPKQELPVIPKFVAEVIEEHKERGYDVYDSIDLIIETNGGGLPSISNWVARNIDKYARAWLDGYETEQEPKYYAKIKGHENIGSNDKYWNYNTDMEELSVGDSEVHPNVISEYMLKATKDEWANLGITDDNAEFELVEEIENE